MVDTEFDKELEQQRAIFKQGKKELIKKYRCLYVAFCKNKLIATGKTYDEALSKAWELTKHTPILVEKVMPEGEEETWLMVSISKIQNCMGK
jgi:hypothetical protein